VDIAVSNQGEVTVVAPTGVLDGKAAMAFERKIAELLDAKTTRLVIDLTRVTLVTSTGIRALVMAAKRLRGGGALALCGLSPQVRSVFDVAGLAGVFTITPSAADAVISVATHGKTQAAVHSRLSRLLLRVLGSGDEVDAPPPEHSGPPSTLAKTVAKLLAGR
jgi:anti-anti-sigma factor